MNYVLILALVVSFAYLGGFYIFGRQGVLSFYTGGVEFILIGALIGSGLLFELPSAVFKGLFPFVHIELGWIGLLYGIQFEWQTLKRYPRVDWFIMGTESLIAMSAVFLAGWLMLYNFVDTSIDKILPVAILMAASASLSSPWTLGIIFNVYRIRTRIVRRLRFISSIDDIPGLLIFATMFLFVSADSILFSLLRFVAGTLTGVSAGWLMVGILRRRTDDQDALIVLIGSTLLMAGISYLLSISVIWIALLAGVVVANAKPRLRDLYPTLAGAEHPFFLLFLMIAGGLWNPANLTALLIALVLIVVRFAAKWSIFEATKKLVNIKGWGGRLSLALATPGGIAVAMVVNYGMYPDRFPLTQLALDVLVWALVILNPLGVILARRALPTGSYPR